MKTITFNPSAGSHINSACETARTISREQSCFVQFNFNDVLLTASPDSTLDGLLASWEAENHRRANTPEAIAERKRYEIQRSSEIAAKQHRLNAFLKVLPGIVGNTDQLMTALPTYTEDSDDIGVTSHCREVADILLAHGYRNNDLVGESPESFDTRPRMARWILGQVINCAEREMSPHPVCCKFIDQYFAMLG